jgi:glutamyl/glutaminyl-tRNA synthetase
MRQERFDGIASKHRDDSVEDNLKHFEEMKHGTEEGLRWCIRAKMSVDNPNKALRDPVIYRCNILPHHRTGYALSSGSCCTADNASQRKMEDLPNVRLCMPGCGLY